MAAPGEVRIPEVQSQADISILAFEYVPGPELLRE